LKSPSTGVLGWDTCGVEVGFQLLGTGFAAGIIVVVAVEELTLGVNVKPKLINAAITPSVTIGGHQVREFEDQ
jgi:hypothetical protein